MKTNSLLSAMLYSMSLLLFFNCNSLFVMWVVMEVNLISFSLMFYNFSDGLNKQVMINSSLYYFLLQSIGSILFLISSIFSFNLLEMSEYLMIFSMSLKLSIFPFFFWMYKICQFMGMNMFVILISIQKIPLLFFCYSIGSYFYIIFILTTLFGSFYLFYSNNFLFLIVSSSIYSSFWILFLFSLNCITMFLFFFLYFMMLIQMGYNIYSNCKFSLSSLFVLKMIFLFIFFVGLPPFSIFFFKILVMYNIFSYWSSVDILIFWLVSFLALFGYVKVFYKSFLVHVEHYLNNEKVFENKSFFYFGGGNFVFFLVF